jgi:hypothetical protein
LDNRTDLVEQINAANEKLKPFLKKGFEGILNDKVKQEAIAGNLF